MERRAIAIQGTVQGVGFRPFVYGLASRLELRGYVRNGVDGVSIEVEGEPHSLDQFLMDLTTQPPPLARIDQVVWERRPIQGDREFQIQQSVDRNAEMTPGAPHGSQIVVSADAATCEACLAELFDPNDRRYHYPFLNCTNCGPRLTIVKSAPYDRVRTTMSGFPMCPACRAEYEDPRNRRFHAQPTACPACGPRLLAADADGHRLAVHDLLRWFAEVLRSGKIGAMKGLGGYHLICDAGNPAAVEELRRRKHREEKPFAVMVRDVSEAREICEVSEKERGLLTSPRAPIVLLRKKGRRDGACEDGGGGAGGAASHSQTKIARQVAPGNPRLGVMLPYTPLHHLLLREAGFPLVMTSGNRSDEPIAYDEPDVFRRLAGIADVFLTHNRPIHVRCDDSVTRVVGECESPIRRSRGCAPRPIALGIECRAPILAVGGQLKNVFAIGREKQAILSHHMGDLDHLEAFSAFQRDIDLYERLFEISPRVIAHDPHPDYASSRYARDRGARIGAKLIAVQHHHAHLASCMAENALDKVVIGISFDGSGYGPDGAVWGGEILIGDFSDFRRFAHLRYVPMPGGEQAVREPWRMAAAHLADAGCQYSAFENRIDPASLRIARRMIERGFNAPMTSSAGRLFDAVAACIGVRDRVSFEGQAAMELEWLAGECERDCSANAQAGRRGYPFGFDGGGEAPWVIDTRPLIRHVSQDIRNGLSPGEIAFRFHSTLAQIAVEACRKARDATGIDTVVLSGGVFMNELLSLQLVHRLEEEGFSPFRHRVVPANDGGLCLGQLAIAARRLEMLDL